MRRSILSLFVIVCMLLTSVAMAEAEQPEVVNGTYKTGLKIAAEPITLKVCVVRNSADQTSSYAVKPFVTRSEQDTGLSFEWYEILSADMDTQMAVMLASGEDIPDIILGSLGSSGQLYDANKTLFADLKDMIPEWAPNVEAFYNDLGVDWNIITDSEDGSIRQLLTGMYRNPGSIVGNLPWIDTAWLENLGLEKPTTVDELYEVLKAFKEQDADGDGDPNNEIPLDFCVNEWFNALAMWATSWGAAGVDGVNYYIIKDGTIMPTANTEGYRAFLEFFHKLYAEGLINPEGFTQTADQFNAHLKAQEVGVWMDWSPQMQRGLSPEADRCVFIGKITAPGYEDAYAWPGNNIYGYGKSFVISEACQHKEAALRWWDYLSSTEELRWLTARGPEGLCWKYGEDGVTHYPTALSDEEKQALIDKYGLTENFDVSMVGASFYMDGSFPLIEENTSYAAPAEGESMAQGYTRLLGSTELKPFVTEGMSKNIVPDEISEELSFTCEGLTDYIQASMADFIINGVTDETWEAYVNELAEYNYDYYLKYYQMQFDGVYE